MRGLEGPKPLGPKTLSPNSTEPRISKQLLNAKELLQNTGAPAGCLGFMGSWVRVCGDDRCFEAEV